ncbi:hypothetical protein INT45_001994, partial [Circinella minor]
LKEIALGRNNPSTSSSSSSTTTNNVPFSAPLTPSINSLSVETIDAKRRKELIRELTCVQYIFQTPWSSVANSLETRAEGLVPTEDLWPRGLKFEKPDTMPANLQKLLLKKLIDNKFKFKWQNK